MDRKRGLGGIGLCECGCGARTTFYKGKYRHFITGHNAWKGGIRISSTGYRLVYDPAHDRLNNGRYVKEHILIAEKVLGKSLPIGSEVHHINGKRSDNRKENLVICQDTAYHRLLEQRTKAYKACGHANWRKCYVCQTYDSPENLYISPSGRSIYHRDCDADKRKGIVVWTG